MTTVPLELPMRANEAAALADLILQMGERQPLSQEVRNRLLSRVPSLGLESLRPAMGSLVKDPTHGSTYYLAVDATSMAGVSKPYLLHMALASAPASAHFLKPTLIGRMRPGGGREIVVNAIPFGPEDIATVRTFGEQVDPGFLPRPQGQASSISVFVEDPMRDLPEAFSAYDSAHKELRMNLAAPIRVENAPELLESSYAAALWGAIRCGWREGYTIEAAFRVTGSDDASIEKLKQSIRLAAGYTKFSLDVTDLVTEGNSDLFNTLFDGVERAWILDEFAREFPLGTGVALRFTSEEIQSLAVRFAQLLSTTEKLYDEIRREKTRSATGRTFDFELRMHCTPRELLFVLHWLKSQGRPVQFAAPYIEEADVVSQTASFAAVTRYFQATLTVTPGDEQAPQVMEQIARACGGRVNLRLTKPHDAAYLMDLASRLR